MLAVCPYTVAGNCSQFLSGCCVTTAFTTRICSWAAWTQRGSSGAELCKGCVPACLVHAGAALHEAAAATSGCSMSLWGEELRAQVPNKPQVMPFEQGEALTACDDQRRGGFIASCSVGNKGRRGTFRVMVSVLPITVMHYGALPSWGQLNTWQPVRNCELIASFTLLECVASALPIKLLLSQTMSFLCLFFQFSHWSSWRVERLRGI